MGKLKQIDNMAEEKGSILVTIWQFVKFIVVSLLAMIVQFVLLNTLNLIPAIKDVIIETDIENKIMKIRPLNGLFDEN